MKTPKTSFERFEYKYWVTASTAQQILRLTAPYLRCDDWAPGGQRNTSLYLDSQELDFMRLHTESAPDRFKLRVRAYGNPPVGPAFFEVKRKIKAVTFKSRAVVPLEAVGPLLRGDDFPGLKLKTAEEESTLSHFLYLMLTNQAEPQVLLTCRREAYTSIDPDEGVRLTMDHDIAFQVTHDYSLQGQANSWNPLCGFGNYEPGASTLVEIKFGGVAPWWIEELVQRLHLIPSSYSKYVAAMAFDELGPGGFLGTDLVGPRSAYGKGDCDMDSRIGWDITLAALLLSFALSMSVSWVYVTTYHGLSYVRSFATTLAIAGVVSALVMLAIGDDVARGIGLVGALTVIRFRTSLKDTRDLMFAFAALSIGVACGVLAFAVAILGTAVFCLAMTYLSFSGFGSRRLYNAVLRLRVALDLTDPHVLLQVLGRYTPGYVLINMRDLGNGSQEHSYHLKLRDPDDKGMLLQGLGTLPGVSGATLLMQETALEP